MRFWRRWHGLREEVTAALLRDRPELVEHAVGEAIAAIHPRLAWTLGDGNDAQLALVISTEGDEELRPFTDAWIAAAPRDQLWEFHDAVPPVPDPTALSLGIGDRMADLSLLRMDVTVDHDHGVVHVRVYHPMMAELADHERTALAFVPLDAALGERLVESRIGQVEPTCTEPVDGLDLLALRELANDVRRAAEARPCPA